VMRYAILISFSVFLVAPTLSLFIASKNFSLDPYSFGPAIFIISLLAFPATLFACAWGAEKHPFLVRGILYGIFLVSLLFLLSLTLSSSRH